MNKSNTINKYIFLCQKSSSSFVRENGSVHKPRILLITLLLMVFTLVGWQRVLAQNVVVRNYNTLSFVVKADTFTGSGYATVNGGNTNLTVSPSNPNTMPTTVAGYAGVHVVVYNPAGSPLTSAQYDALVQYIRDGGVVIADFEYADSPTPATYLEVLDRLLGAGHGITKTAVNTVGITPVNFSHPSGSGTLNLKSATNTSTPTTGTYATFSGVPSAARILAGTSNTGCNGTALDFVVPTFPGVPTTLNGQTVKGMMIMSGEVQGPFTGGTGNTRSLAMDQAYAKLIYDFYNDPNATAARRSWSQNTANVNAACGTTATYCNAGSAAPTLSSTTASNPCPATTVNLGNLVTSATPAGASLVWFTNSTHTGAAYATPTAATSGTYYAFYYDAVGNCYSPASAAVTVTTAKCNVAVNDMSPCILMRYDGCPGGSTQDNGSAPDRVPLATAGGSPDCNFIGKTNTATQLGTSSTDGNIWDQGGAGSTSTDHIGESILLSTSSTLQAGVTYTFKARWAAVSLTGTFNNLNFSLQQGGTTSKARGNNPFWLDSIQNDAGATLAISPNISASPGGNATAAWSNVTVTFTPTANVNSITLKPNGGDGSSFLIFDWVEISKP